MYFDEERNEVRTEDCDFRSLTPIDRLVLNSERVKAIEMVIDHYKEENKKLTADTHCQIYGRDSVTSITRYTVRSLGIVIPSILSFSCSFFSSRASCILTLPYVLLQ